MTIFYFNACLGGLGWKEDCGHFYTHCITKAIVLLRSSRSSLNFLPSSHKDLIYQKVVGGTKPAKDYNTSPG